MPTEALRAALTALSPAQALAVTALIGGATHAEAAEAAGVARETVSRWLAHHPAMRAAVIEAQAAAYSEQALAVARVRSRATEVAIEALDAIATAIEDGSISDPVAALRAVTPLATAAMSAPEVLDADTLLDTDLRRLRVAGHSDFDRLMDDSSGHLALARLAEAADATG